MIINIQQLDKKPEIRLMAYGLWSIVYSKRYGVSQNKVTPLKLGLWLMIVGPWTIVYGLLQKEAVSNF